MTCASHTPPVRSHPARQCGTRCDTDRIGLRTGLGPCSRVCGFIEKTARGCARTAAPGSVDRGEEATGGAIEDEAAVLPGCALAETCQPLHVAPDGAGIRLVRFR